MPDQFKDINILGGVTLPLLFAVYGVYCVAMQKALLIWFMIGRSGTLDLEGETVVAMGIAWLCLAGALSSHFVIGRMQESWRFGSFLTPGCLLAMLIAFGVVMWRVTMAAFS